MRLGGRRAALRTRWAFAIAAAAVVLLALPSLSSWARQDLPSTREVCTVGTAAPPTARTPITHVFWIIKENHAFENYFGDLPGVAGYPPSGNFPVAYGSNATISPFPLDGATTPDLPHDHASYVADLAGGANDLYVAQARAMGDAAPQDAVGYYTARQLPDYYAYAQEFGLGDAFFSGVLGPTNPNRFFDLSGYVGNWTSDTALPRALAGTPTILDQFTRAGLPWTYAYSGAGGNRTIDGFLASDALAPCELPNVRPIGDLAGELVSATPPTLTVVDTSWDMTYGEHPPGNVTLGEEWTVALVNEIFSSPVGGSSLVLLSYDEGGGFWDPAMPPTVGGSGDGPRVPLLVLSPWTPAGTRVHTQLDPTSILAFLDSNWGLPPLTSRVASAPGLGGFFAFSSPPRTVPLRPTNVTLPSGGAAFVAPSIPPVAETGPQGGVSGASPGDLYVADRSRGCAFR